MEKYAEYIGLFDRKLFHFEDSVEECMQAVFKDDAYAPISNNYEKLNKFAEMFHLMQ